MKPIREYYGSGDHTGSVFVKEYPYFFLFETWEYKTKSRTLIQAFFNNGKIFEKKHNESWKRL